jgi:serine/threonine protein kinase
MPEPAITQIGGRYQLIDVIGRGGMGIVYRGYDVSMSRQVAIKMLHGFDAEDKDTVLARFHREVTSLAALQHKNIVTIYTFEQHEGKPYMVMEFLEGLSLEKMISSHEQVELTEKLNLILQVCDGLQYAHENGLIHRDIKPANILVLKNGTAKLIDFGIARVGLSETLTKTGLVVGSPSWMSPEQINNHVLDARTDVWSAGVVLFQLLTGELPFEGADMSGTISQVLNAPTPPLSTYLKNYPKELDEIVGRALAKKVDERYQSAEDFGFDISQVLEALKRGLIDEYIRRAKILIEKRDWEAARQQLQEIRKIDRRNETANELLQNVTRELQRQQKTAQVAQLRAQAQLALSQAQYEEALEYLEQGLRLDEGDAESIALRELVRQGAKRAQDLDDALRRSQAAFYAGDLAEAQLAIEQALAIEPGHTEARTLGHLIQREVAERSKRVQLQGFMDAARTEIGKKNFVEALQFIQKAKEVDPSEPSIQELLSWASRGYAQEKARKELETSSSEIGLLLQGDRYQEALSACDVALEKFPEEVSLLKLRELAKRQFEVQSRRIAVDEIGNAAREHANAGAHDMAVLLLEKGLQTYPGDTSLETFLAITRAEMEHMQRESAEREAFRNRNQVQDALVDAPVQEPSEVRGLLQRLRIGLVEKASISSLREIAGQLKSLDENRLLGTPSLIQFGRLSTDLEARQASLSRDLAELEALRLSLAGCNVTADIAGFVDRSRSINDQYPREDDIGVVFQDILHLAHDSKLKRDAAATRASSIVRDMQATQELAELLSMQKQVDEASRNWPDDAYLQSLVDQASARVGEVRTHKRQTLDELVQIEETLASARSVGQLRLLEEQAKIVSSDFIGDPDVANAIGKISLIEQNKLQLIDRICSALKEFATRIAKAQTLEEAEECAKLATNAASDGMNFEEVDELIRKVQRPIEERKKDYARIERNLNLLVESSTRATGLAELDLILARRRDLLKKYSEEACFQELQERLEVSVSEQRVHLSELAAAEAEDSLEASEDEADFAEFVDASKPGEVQTQPLKQAENFAATAVQSRPRGFSVSWMLVGGGVLAAAVAAFLIVPRTSRINIDPASATILVDGRSCEAPCSLRLMPGHHEVIAKQSGFQDLVKTVDVPWGGGDLPVLAMTRIPAATPPTAPTMTQSDAHLGGEAKIIVNTSMPGVTVFVDNGQAGTTGKDGSFEFVTKAAPHRVRVEKPGYQPVPPEAIRLNKDQVATVFFSLKPTPAVEAAKNDNGNGNSQGPATIATNSNVATTPGSGQPPPDSFIVLKAPAGAVVHVDQQSSGQSTGEPYRIKAGPGQHTVEVFLPGNQPWKQTVSVDPGKSADLVASLVPVPAPAAGTTTTSPMTRPATGVSDEDRKQIQQLLDRYADGYSQKNLKLIQTLWPSIPSDEIKLIKGFFKDSKSVEMKMHLNGAIQAGNRITVDFTQTLRYNLDGKEAAHTDSKTLYVIKNGSDWLIDYIPTS